MQHVTAMVAASALALMGSAPAAAAAHCPAGGKTVVKTSTARIWGVTPKSEITRYYGCAFAVGRVVRLDPPHGQLIAYKPKVRIAGTAVAYEAMSFDLKPFRVYVRSLRTGKVIHSATSNKRGSSDGHTGPVQRIVLKRNGSVAWTTSSDCICEGLVPSGYEVHAIGTADRRRILDSGQAVDPTFLRLGASRIFWKHDGAVRSAALR